MKTHTFIKTLALVTIFSSSIHTRHEDAQKLKEALMQPALTDESYDQTAGKAATLATTLAPLNAKYHQVQKITTNLEKYHKENNHLLDGRANKTTRETINTFKAHRKTYELNLKNADQHLKLGQESLQKIYNILDRLYKEAQSALNSLHTAVENSSPRMSAIHKTENDLTSAKSKTVKTKTNKKDKKNK